MAESVTGAPVSENPEECEGCHFEMTALKFYEGWQGSARKIDGKWLCELCAGTMMGNTLDYPTMYDSATKDVLQAICYVGNVILKAINSGR